MTASTHPRSLFKTYFTFFWLSDMSSSVSIERTVISDVAIVPVKSRYTVNLGAQDMSKTIMLAATNLFIGIPFSVLCYRIFTALLS